eukprot:1156319-Pelagomonas_calceolata.AAC.19
MHPLFIIAGGPRQTQAHNNRTCLGIKLLLIHISSISSQAFAKVSFMKWLGQRSLPTCCLSSLGNASDAATVAMLMVMRADPCRKERTWAVTPSEQFICVSSRGVRLLRQTSSNEGEARYHHGAQTHICKHFQGNNMMKH